jgi:(p)ppGpp synthase/HD superfamily hydrolase
MNLSDRFAKAFKLAHKLHQHQERKSGKIPYISHLMGVSSIVMRYGGNEDEAIAALLHDAAEDQGGEKILAYIRNRFGDPVADIVLGCSDTTESPKPPWKERKERYIGHLREANESTLIVAASDKLYNALDCVRTHAVIGERLWDLFTPSREETKWYYRSIAEVLEEREMEFPHLSPLFAETIRVINQLLELP